MVEDIGKGSSNNFGLIEIGNWSPIQTLPPGNWCQCLSCTILCTAVTCEIVNSCISCIANQGIL